MEKRKSYIPLRTSQTQEKNLKDKNSQEDVAVIRKEGSAVKNPKEQLRLPKIRNRISSDTALLPPLKKLKVAAGNKKSNENYQSERIPLVNEIDNGTRSPLVDLDRNVRTRSSSQSNIQIVNNGTLLAKDLKKKTVRAQDNKKEVKLEKTEKQHVDKSKITVRKRLTPRGEVAASDIDQDIDEVFIDGTQHLLFYKPEISETNDVTSLNGDKQFSPIKPNLYGGRNTIVYQGIPNKLRKPSKKLTLLHRSQQQGGNNKQNNIEADYLDVYNIEYLEDIVLHELKNDWKYIIPMDTVKFRNAGNREIRVAIINWTIQAQDFLELPIPILFVTVQLFDRMFESICIPTNMCQLVVLVLMWIINKYEDNVNVIKISKMLALCNGAYTTKEFLKMERKILTFFNFDLNIPDVTVYAMYYIKKLDVECELLVQCVYYILECYALNIKFSAVIPSVKAAAATSLVLDILYPQKKVWNRLEKNIGYYGKEELQDIMNKMLQQLHVIQDPEYKYRQPFYKYAVKEKVQVSVVILRKLLTS